MSMGVCDPRGLPADGTWPEALAEGASGYGRKD